MLVNYLNTSETKTITIRLTNNSGNSYKGKIKVRILDLYTITYNLNGGSCNNCNTIKYTKKTETFTLPQPSKNGYTFKGWTGGNGNNPQTSVTIAKGSTGNKSYVANWHKNDFVVTRNILNQGHFYNVTPTYLTNQIDNSDGFRIVGTATGNNVYQEGCYYCEHSTWLRWDYSMDLTDIAKITFYGKEDALHGMINVMITDGIYDGGNLGPGYNYYGGIGIHYNANVTNYTYYEIDTSNISGIKVISFIGGYIDQSGSSASSTSYCNIRFVYN